MEQATQPVDAVTPRLGRRWARPRLLVVVAVGVSLALLLTLLGYGMIVFNLGPADALTYLAAGDRLNHGNPLYSVSPDDTYILGSKPPYWTVPLLSPPFIAVIWRPLAAMGFAVPVAIWWAGAMVAIGLVLAAMLRSRPLLASAAIIAFSIPLTFQVPTGNVNGYLLLAAVATWWFFRERRDLEAGVVVAVATGLKLTPAVLFIWLVTQRRWGSVRAFAVTAVAVAAISLLGAGWDNHLAYLDVIRDTNAIGTSELSLAGFLRGVGVPAEIARFSPWVLLVVGAVVMAWQRARPGRTYSLAVLLMVWASPVVNLDWLVLMLAALAPLMWPLRREGEDQPAAGASVRTEVAPSS
jgi:alpha-1,2-mannosyltransferase